MALCCVFSGSFYWVIPVLYIAAFPGIPRILGLLIEKLIS